MKYKLRNILIIFASVSNGFLFADGESFIIAHLSNALESLSSRNEQLSGHSSQSDFSDLHKKVHGNIKKIKDRIEGYNLFGSEEAILDLVKSGAGVIESFLKNQKNFDFLQALSDEQRKNATVRANKHLVFFRDNIHHKQFEMLDNVQKTIDMRIKKLQEDLNSLSYLRSSNLIIDSKNLFLRLIKLVESKSAIYGVDQLDYPKEIKNEDDLNKFEPEIKSSNFYIEKTKLLLSISYGVNKIIQQQVSNINLTNTANNQMFNYFAQLDSMIALFNNNFSKKEPLFNDLVNKSLEAISSARLKASDSEFNKGLEGLDLGQKEQITRSMRKFAKSPAVKFYLFSGAPIRNLMPQGIKLNDKLKAMVKNVKVSVDLDDLKKIGQWFINEIFEYASSTYSEENEFYYSRIFTYVNGVFKQLDKYYRSDAKLYAKNIEKNQILSSYLQIVRELKEFRKKYLPDLHKAIDAILKNPYNDQFKQSLLNLNKNNLKHSEELLVKLTSSQYFLKSLIGDLVNRYNEMVKKVPSFLKLRREVDQKGQAANESLAENMEKNMKRLEKTALKSWAFENSVANFTNAVDKLFKTLPSKDQDEKSIDEILREKLKKIRHEEEEEADEEEEEWEEED